MLHSTLSLYFLKPRIELESVPGTCDCLSKRRARDMCRIGPEVPFRPPFGTYPKLAPSFTASCTRSLCEPPPANPRRLLSHLLSSPTSFVSLFSTNPTLIFLSLLVTHCSVPGFHCSRCSVSGLWQSILCTILSTIIWHLKYTEHCIGAGYWHVSGSRQSW